MEDKDFKAIDSAAKDGQVKIVKLGPNYARAYWTGDMWAYDFGADSSSVHQIDFEPTHYFPLPV